MTFQDFSGPVGTLFLAERTPAHNKVGYWHHTVICLSVCLSVMLHIVHCG